MHNSHVYQISDTHRKNLFTKKTEGYCTANRTAYAMISEKVSFIVPVYNVEKYLPKCLESILSQTHRNIEVIMIDDASPDKCAEITERYMKNDERIKLIRQENTGLSGARNTGLKHVTGDWIIFVDSDDWIDSDTCENALAAARDNDVQAVLWGYVREYADRSLEKHIFSGDVHFSGESMRQLHRRFVGLFGSELSAPEDADSVVTAWGKMYKADLILNSDVRFTERKLIGSTEDALFNMALFGLVKNAVYIDKCMYHYRKDNDVSLTRKYNDNLYRGWQHLYDLMGNYIASNSLGKDFETALLNRIAFGAIGLGLNETTNPDGVFKQIRNLKKFLSAERYRKAYKQLELKYFPIHWKAFFLCCKLNFASGLFVLIKVIQKITGR